MVAANTRRIVIEPVTRVEGHGKVTILLDEENRVRETRLHIVEFRGFERFVQGRPYWEMPVLVQRLCGICPVSHHLCAAKATDMLVGADQLTPTAEKLRRLMHYGQTFQSHALHFFYLASPDLLFGFEADPAVRNVVGVAAKYPDLALHGVLMRKYGQEVIKATAGKRIHGTGAIPGGINKSLSVQQRDELLKQIDQMIEWSHEAVKIARDYVLEHLETAQTFGAFESNHLSILRDDGALDLYDGKLKAINATGETIFENVPVQQYLDYLAEEVRPWSYMKFPFIKSLGPEQGWYRVGPLARMNTCRFIDTPEADAARKEFVETLGSPSNSTLAYHWARMIEVLHSAEKMRDLLNDPDILGNDLVVSGERRDEGMAVLEAPRGTLFHHYRINKNDQIVMANMIVATTNNNEPMNQAVRRVAEEQLSGRPEITEGMLNQIEVAIRAYDPCLSCATHAYGQMPLEVKLIGVDGEVLDVKRK